MSSPSNTDSPDSSPSNPSSVETDIPNGNSLDDVMNIPNATNGYESATATYLKICRMSKTSGIATGGEEVFIFCERVKKNDISVVFAELNPENQVIWEGFGEFGPNDVHHQFGIAFRTPSYSNPNISEPVTVQVSLKRPSDGEMSEPIEYRFTPVPLDPESTQRKRKKAMPRFALVPISAVSGGASVMSTSTINSIPLNMGSFGITNGQMPIFLNSMTGSIMTPGHKNTGGHVVEDEPDQSVESVAEVNVDRLVDKSGQN